MRTCIHLLLALVMLAPVPALAQDERGSSEVIVTGIRREADDFDESRPAVGLRRTADFAVLSVTVSGDTRDADKRRDEIYAMIKSALDAAARNQVELATSDDGIVFPLTLANYRDLGLRSGNRPDTGEVTILVKTRLGSGTDGAGALQRIERFVKAVPAVGRAEMKATGDLTLSVVAPDQYREAILDLVAADARRVSGKLGAGYGVEIKGLDRPVEWSRGGPTDVFLYVPYNMVVRPAS
jgi:hypothetical protein